MGNEELKPCRFVEARHACTAQGICGLNAFIAELKRRGAMTKKVIDEWNRRAGEDE